MRAIILGLFTWFLVASASFAAGHSQEGWIVKDSANSVKDTADKLVAIIEGAPPKVFERVDHAAGAKSIDQELPEATLVIFGAPAIGTPIMQQNIKAGLDLPVRVLIWDDNGQTRIGYLDPMALKERYAIEGADEAFKTMAGAIGKFTDGAAK